MSSNIWTPGASVIPSGMLGECMPWHSFFSSPPPPLEASNWLCSQKLLLPLHDILGCVYQGYGGNPISVWQGMGEGVCGLKYF